MKRALLPLLFLAGVALAAGLAIHAGLSGVGAVLAQVGWAGLGLICLIHLAALLLCAAGWRCVTDKASFAACLGARWIRDGSSNLVGFIPAIGEVISARALTLLSAETAEAAAAGMVVDVAAETLSQALYAMLGFALLVQHLAPGDAWRWLAITLVAIVPLLALFAASRNSAVLNWSVAVGARIARFLGLASPDAGGGLAAAIHALQRQPRRVIASTALHLLAWTMGAAQIWALSRGLDHPLSLGDSLILESLVYAARAAFFLVPWGAGVQEGALIAVGALVGIDAPTAIALSLALRARDVVFGAPSLAFWYLAEGRRFWVRRVQT